MTPREPRADGAAPPGGTDVPVGRRTPTTRHAATGQFDPHAPVPARNAAHGEPTRTADRRARAPGPPPPPTTGITVYGCEPDEAVLFRRSAARFGVLPTLTEEPLSEATVGLAVGNRSISISHKTRVTGTALRALGRVGVTYISTRSIGYDHIDVRYAESVGIRVENVSYSPDSVADYTLMLMLMAVRHTKATICRASTHDYRLNEVRGKELRDLTVGVVGTGRIGAAVLDRLRGFGCRTLAHDRFPAPGTDHVPLDELLERSDIVTLHTPLTAETHHILDRRRFARMKRGAFVVNTGRGALIATDDLLGALESGRLGGAALDVLEGEEGIFYADHRGAPPDNDPLRRLHALPNVIISPHTAYHTDHALSDTVENSLTNCLEFESRNHHE